MISYRTKWEKREQMHRNSSETEDLMRGKKLIGKTSWYKRKAKKDNRQPETDSKGARGKEPKTDRSRPLTERRPSAILSMERTKGDKLITELRRQEQKINKFIMRKVKLVERNGQQVQQMLTNPDPCGDELCERPDCLPCKGTEGKEICRTRIVVYSTRCKICKAEGRDTKYVGETSRSLYERTSEHGMGKT